MYFERLNDRLGRELRNGGSTLRIATEEFRDPQGVLTARRAPGSIGADVIVRDTLNPALMEMFDLKTFGTAPTPIPLSRQGQFVDRFKAPAQELFRKR